MHAIIILSEKRGAIEGTLVSFWMKMSEDGGSRKEIEGL